MQWQHVQTEVVDDVVERGGFVDRQIDIQRTQQQVVHIGLFIVTGCRPIRIDFDHCCTEVAVEPQQWLNDMSEDGMAASVSAAATVERVNTAAHAI